MVIVIGAGFAGLEAAATVAAAGREVRVLEARKRVGGRVHSQRLPNGAVIELGAEFILPGNTYIRDRAAELGLGLWDKGVRYGQRESRGGRAVSEADLQEALATVRLALEAEPGRGAGSVAELLARLEIAPGARDYMLARTEISAAAPAANVPAGELLGLAKVGREPSPSIAGGNQELARALAERVGTARIELGARVTSVTDQANRILVGTTSGELAAAAVIIAIPASVLPGLRLDPPPPPRQAAAFEAIEYGHAAKLFVPLSATSPEPTAVMSVPERYWSWTATGAGGRPQAVVSSFAGSAGALERLRVEFGPQHWLGSLARLRPELELEPDGALLSTWSDDPLIGAAYSLPAPAERLETLRAPLAGGRIQFAGEHLAGQFSALMEGALRSGRDAARRLLAVPV